MIDSYCLPLSIKETQDVLETMKIESGWKETFIIWTYEDIIPSWFNSIWYDMLLTSVIIEIPQ